ncbi:hypothetical protein CVT25_011257 [Psilocybe cyanescens]|uniref:Uncharacterized protein n=1 Tax=Psilocybe cyanescens TaxID=93625 RepID=A0A409X0Z8_PSICY|nr:hypothetical protein CVT25_011257 [Psilocybe cyanescens]
MFILSTADVALTMRILGHDIVYLLDPNKHLQIERLLVDKLLLFVTNNFIADLILLYRCYMVWGRSKYILIGASFLVLADTLWGYLGMGGPSVALPQTTLLPLYVWSIFGINVIMTTVTVGRIFWVSRVASSFTGPGQLQSYSTAMTILVESSLIYSTCILIYILFPSESPYRLVMVIICMRLVAIMPTLLIVQVGLGRVIREADVTNTMSEFEGNSPSVILDTLITSMQGGDRSSFIFRPHLVDEEAQDAFQETTDTVFTKMAPDRQNATQ